MLILLGKNSNEKVKVVEPKVSLLRNFLRNILANFFRKEIFGMFVIDEGNLGSRNMEEICLRMRDKKS